MNLVKHDEAKMFHYTNIFSYNNCDSKKSIIIQDILLTQNRIIDCIYKLEKLIKDSANVIGNN
jgi:hypothetical protein